MLSEMRKGKDMERPGLKLLLCAYPPKKSIE